jgi:hypothetical protein
MSYLETVSHISVTGTDGINSSNRGAENRSVDKWPGERRSNAQDQTRLKVEDLSNVRDGDGPNIGTFGVGVGEHIALGVGVGAQLTENYRVGSGFEASAAAFVVAGPIISVPLPIPIPSLEFGLSAPPSKATGVEAANCSPMAMFVTPISEAKMTFDPTTRDIKSFSLSVTIAIQMGFAVGVQCDFTAR